MEENFIKGELWLQDGQIRPTIGYTDNIKKDLNDFGKLKEEVIKRNINEYSFWYNSFKWNSLDPKLFHIKCNIHPVQFFEKFEKELGLEEGFRGDFIKNYKEDCYSHCIQSIFGSNDKIMSGQLAIIQCMIMDQKSCGINLLLIFLGFGMNAFLLIKHYKKKNIRGYSITLIPFKDENYLIGIRIDSKDFSKIFFELDKKWNYKKIKTKLYKNKRDPEELEIQCD